MRSPSPVSARATLELDIGPIAHGGHCVARHEDRVIFVRHALPAERVRVQVREGGNRARYWRADTVEVLRASPHRVRHFWPEADALLAYQRGQVPIGGAEFGHIDLATQGQLKAQVLREQLARLAGTDAQVTVVGLSQPAGGLNWRTRIGLAVAATGQVGMHPHRNLGVVPIATMPLAVEAIGELPLSQWNTRGLRRIDIAAAQDQPPSLRLVGPLAAARALAEQIDGVCVVHVNPDGGHRVLRGESTLTERVGDWALRVSSGGFWQIHRSAPALLTAAVKSLLESLLQPGDTAVDLYAGAGLFTTVLADLVGPRGQVWSVEGSPVTHADALVNFAHVPQVRPIHAAVERALAGGGTSLFAHAGALPPRAIVLDPPRAGAGREVLAAVAALKPGGVVYVSCDPATFSRDLGYFRDLGWQLVQLRGFDLYPHTHHVETVALLMPATSEQIGGDEKRTLGS